MFAFGVPVRRALGIAVTGLAPILTLRRLRRMSVPSTLRVVE